MAALDGAVRRNEIIDTARLQFRGDQGGGARNESIQYDRNAMGPGAQDQSG